MIAESLMNVHHRMMPCYVTIMGWVCHASYKRLNKSLTVTVEGIWNLRFKEDAKR